MAGDRSEVRESDKATRLGTLAGRLMQTWCATLRFEITDRCDLTRPGGISGPVIYCLWHNRIFTMPAAWKKACGKHRQAVVLTSASHDGAALARAVGVFGIGSVRGSSSRRGVAALVAMRKALRENTDVCITPDGPRGPKHVIQPGIIKLAEASGASIVPIHVEYSSCRELKTWDRFAIPAPGSKVRVIFDEALAVPGGLSEDDFETWRRRLEEIMLRGAEPTSDYLR
ncbi:MAG: DUF374 domain-containing protein [Verrucomicrobiaceae bacterium]|nr:MAG: DUF374 domain-containing protein [Verrucomicrobiaceae bacterium]